MSERNVRTFVIAATVQGRDAEGRPRSLSEIDCAWRGKKSYFLAAMFAFVLTGAESFVTSAAWANNFGVAS